VSLRGAACASLLFATAAAAEPPAPLVLPDLTPATEVRASTILGGWPWLDFAAGLAVQARTPVASHGEIFARIVEYGANALTGTQVSLGGGGLDAETVKGLALSNIQFGARRMFEIPERRLAVAVSAWSWIPTATGSGLVFRDTAFVRAGHADLLLGLQDPYMAFDGVGAGAAGDLRWSDDRWFVQLEIGAMAVRDYSNLEIDDVFTAIGGGASIAKCTTLTGEVRFVQHPTGANFGAGERDWAVSMGVASSDRSGASVRFRAGPVFGGDVVSAVAALDLTVRIE